jgi:2-dehydropantoate 2-reductase
MGGKPDSALNRKDPPSAEIKFLVFGAGAIGTYLGGSLTLQGHPVVFLVRPGTAAELERRGLRLKLGDREHQIDQPQITDSIEEALARGPYQAAIFALKSYDTRVTVESLAPYSAEVPPLLCLQNGVENEMVISAGLGEGKVIPGTVTTSIGRRAVGDIVLERLRGVGVGAEHPISGSLVSIFNQAGLNARLFPDAAGMKWSKLLTNLLSNATAAILDMTPAQVFAHRGLFRIEIEQLREALRVMSAQKIRVVNLPGTPVRALAFATLALPTLFLKLLLSKAVAGGRGGKMPSLHIDLHLGRGLSEVDHLNGAVVRAGERLSLRTPVNRILAEMLLALTRGEIPLDTFAHQPERLLQEIRKRGSGGL